jgi:hypothetical protein
MPTLGDGTNEIINPEGVGWCGVVGASDLTLSGLMKFGETVTQGSPALRANPGLSDGVPLGFGNDDGDDTQRLMNAYPKCF